MGYGALTGRKRRENPVGRVAGAFVVARPVGKDWVTSECFVFACKHGCGYEIARKPKQFSQVAAKPRCPKCGGTADG